jgi:hypothetical protein
MNTTRQTASEHALRPRIFLTILLGLLAAVACGSSDGNQVLGPTFSVSFAGSGTAAAPDMVRLTGTSVGDTLFLSVAIGGPTTSDELCSFSFDLVIGDPTVIEYVSAEAGDVLTGDLLNGLSVTPDSLQSDHLLVSAVLPRGSDCSGVASDEGVIVRLTFRALQEGTSALTLVQPWEAADSTGPIPSIQFDSASAMVAVN